MTHRKHVHVNEIEPIAAVIREKLIEMVPLYDPKSILNTEYEQPLFHALYRFENHSVGKPAYPEPDTWGTLAEYLGVMVPLITLFQGEPRPTADAPQTDSRAGVIIKEEL